MEVEPGTDAHTDTVGGIRTDGAVTCPAAAAQLDAADAPRRAVKTRRTTRGHGDPALFRRNTTVPSVDRSPITAITGVTRRYQTVQREKVHPNKEVAAV